MESGFLASLWNATAKILNHEAHHALGAHKSRPEKRPVPQRHWGDTRSLDCARDDKDFCSYCGLAGSLVAGVELAAGVALEGATGVLVAGAVWELGVADSDFGRSGTVVIALSGLSR
jgi:hypothetical protein